ncbi:MAG: CheR family methyltransferase [Campylobacterota bacterium]|nr:CheR family methyltransferase [Campylobacterota bacterium]
MSIIVSKSKDITKILIDSFMYIKDIESFLTLTDNKTDSFEINILNIMVVPLRVLKRLHKIQKRSQIFTNDISLRNYLKEFNIDIHSDECLTMPNYINKIDYIAIGGSAGSLEKIRDIISKLPASNITIFILMHQKEDKNSKLRSILQNYTEHYKVIDAVSDQKVMPRTIYVAPSSKHMIVAGGYIFLLNTPKKNFSKPSISVLFESLSTEYNKDLLAILVCGYGKDGSDSLKALKECGATVFIEDPKECQATPMLENAIKSKNFDAVISLQDINSFIKSAVIYDNNISDQEIDIFLTDIYKIYGFDYRKYQRGHISRRIHHFCNLVQPENFDELKKLILTDRRFFKKLFLDISINVTTLFRDPKVFKSVRDQLIPNLDSFKQLKIWCAGCSTGEEPYSLAILLKELGLLDKSIIYATDINKIVMQKAKNGIYSKNSFDLFKQHYKKSGGNEKFENYFDIEDDYVIIKDDIKEKIVFLEHNLAMDSIINEFQLIFCRNVMIYFDSNLKNRVIKLFDDSLVNNGFLVLGSSEVIDKSYTNFKKFTTKEKIYQKII